MTQLPQGIGEENTRRSVKDWNKHDCSISPQVRLPVVEHRKPTLPVRQDTSKDSDSRLRSRSSSSSLSSTLPYVASSTSHQSNTPHHREPNANLPHLSDEHAVRRQTEQPKEKGGYLSAIARRKMQAEQARQKRAETSRQSQAASSAQKRHSDLMGSQSSQPRQIASLGLSSSSSSGDNANARTLMILNGIRQTTSTPQTSQRAIDMRSSVSRTTAAQDKFRHNTTPRLHAGPSQLPNGLAVSVIDQRRTLPRQADWRSWQQVSVKLFQIPEAASVHDLRDCFNKEGNVVYIEIFEDSQGQRMGSGRVEFRPPPARPFWNERSYRLDITGRGYFIDSRLEDRRIPALWYSAANSKRGFPERMIIQAQSLSFGIMYSPTAMMSKRSVQSSPTAPIKFGLNMRHRELMIEFELVTEKQRSTNKPHAFVRGMKETLMFSIPFQQMQNIFSIQAPEKILDLVISLETPPKFFKRVDGFRVEEDKGRQWTERDIWYRQTDIVHAPGKLKNSAVTLKKFKPILDLGRWTTYRLRFELSKEAEITFKEMREALQEYNIDVFVLPRLILVEPTEPFIWRLIDSQPPVESQVNGGLGSTMADTLKPSFNVRYQLEVCISRGVLNEHNMTEEFVKRLYNMDSERCRELLEYLVTQKSRVYDPMSIFTLQVPASTSIESMPHYCTLVRSVTVTPTTLHFNTPTVETSNRILRQYPKYTDRFIRVRFTDESTEGKIYATHKITQNEVFTRIKRAMTNGITIGDRHYRFLAFGNAQFREHGAYFFAPLPDLTTLDIRVQMGSFNHITGVALFGSRLGQCFSTTRAITTQAEVVEIDDIERKGYLFSDGVGKISPALAEITADSLGLTRRNREAPSVFQFRLGGCKGVLTVWPGLEGKQLHIRESQYKFPASHEGLEIIRWSQFASANLNRQLILVLSTLGVQDAVFRRKLREQLVGIDRAMKEPEKALEILQKQIDHNQMTLKLAGMILDGFQTRREPFIISLLNLWRAWSIKYLKEKARITVNEGALLLGCLDETASLKGHYNNAPTVAEHETISEKAKNVPEIFVQMSKGPDGKPEVILGPMLLARNPSLHPGDIRVVCGVDVPELRHLNDCVVLPQTGDRDLASMCSGGDLDGDDFAVIWDQDLLPKEWNHQPMDYTAPSKLVHQGPITDDDLTTFFITYMKNDSLPTIALAHVANADWADNGVKDSKCLQLASLHSTAVDFVKTGQPANMPKELTPRKWPHFMEKKGKPESQIYISHRILGQLYDLVERVSFVPAFDCPFDERILRAYNLNKDMIEEARNLKQDYDAHIKRIMAQHAIKNEFEVWSTFVIEHNNSNDFKFHEEIGRISTALKDQFRSLCWKKAGGKQYEQIGPFVAAMYKVTAEEMAMANKECREMHMVNGRKQPRRQAQIDQMPLMSFPWLFQDILGKIAKLNALGPGQADETNLIEIPSAAPLQAQSMAPKAIRIDPAAANVEDDLKTAQGITHRGDLLELQFGESAQPKINDEPLATSQTAKTEQEAKIPHNSKDHALAQDLNENRNKPGHVDEKNEGSSRDNISEVEDEEIVHLGEREFSIHMKLASLDESTRRP